MNKHTAEAVRDELKEKKIDWKNLKKDFRTYS
jgi:hypothetical protein